jgi:hypothetical protein
MERPLLSPSIDGHLNLSQLTKFNFSVLLTYWVLANVPCQMMKWTVEQTGHHIPWEYLI